MKGIHFGLCAMILIFAVISAASGQDVCTGVTCENDGICQVLNGYPQCYCTFGYEGEFCDTVIIDTEPPQFSGCPGDLMAPGVEGKHVFAYWNRPSVWDDSTRYTLTSDYLNASGYFQPNTRNTVTYTAVDPSGNQNICEFDVITVTSCSDNLCQNGGTCQQYDSTQPPYCICELGFSGQTCENGRLNCQNGGSCQHDSCQECMCSDGYTGPSCEFEISTEKINPIMVGCPTGVYVAVDDPNDNSTTVTWDIPDSYDNSGRFSMSSTFQPGHEFWKGQREVNFYHVRDAAENYLFCCYFNIVVGEAECSTGRVCENGGKCLQMDGEDRCYCPTGYAGENCERENTEVDPLDCSASCDTGYSGQRCEVGGAFQISAKITVVLAGVAAAVSFILI